MSLVLIATVIALSVAVIATVAMLVRTPSGARRSIGHIDKYGFFGPAFEDEAAETERPRTIGGFASWVGDAIATRYGPKREEALRAKLISAGLYQVSPGTFFLSEAVGALGCFALWGFGLFSGVSPAIYIIGLVVALGLGWALPSIVLARRLKDRYHAIEKALPDLIDLLVVTVEAGLGFTASLRMASEQLRGPLAQELRLTLQEQSMGRTTAEAMDGLGQRADTPGVRSFVRAIVQGELLGVSIGKILRNLALEMRKKRKAHAEELAHKAPVKMLFPLVLLIFPAMFVVLLLPALISIRDTLGR